MRIEQPQRVFNVVQHALNRSHARAGTPWNEQVPFHPPRGRYTAVHYGLMFPDLPEPLNFLDFITVIGQPKIKLWRNDHLIETSAADTANLLVGSAVRFPGQFRGYSIERDLEVAEDSSLVRFGGDFTFEGRYPNFAVAYRNAEFEADFQIEASDKIAHFAKLIGGLYDHWSVLCRYTGTVRHNGRSIELSGLNTLEYARGVSVRLPFTFFAYQILNIDDNTQVLMVELRGPAGIPLQQAVYVRSFTDHGGVFEKGFEFTVHDLENSIRTTPNGLTMRLATAFGWRVDDEDGGELIRIDARCNDDYIFGMGGGYVGSFEYTGHFRGKSIEGVGYGEYCGTH
ncbi:DUF6670 family protein [Mycolicibacter minnesotensis]